MTMTARKVNDATTKDVTLLTVSIVVVVHTHTHIHTQTVVAR